MAKFNFNRGAIKPTSERRHAEGAFCRIITDVERWEREGNDDIVFRVESEALRDPDDINSKVAGTKLSDFLTLPFDNPEVDGHQAPSDDYAQWKYENLTDFLSAVFPNDVDHRPRRVEADDEGNLIGDMIFRGNPIQKNQFKECNEEAKNTAGEAAIEIFDDVTQMVNKVFFCRVVRSTNKKNGKTYTNLKGYRAELPDWWELETDRFMENVDLTTQTEEAA